MAFLKTITPGFILVLVCIGLWVLTFTSNSIAAALVTGALTATLIISYILAHSKG